MIPRLFTPLPLSVGATVALDPAAAHHASRVLRLAPGAAIELFDGEGRGAAASLLSAAAGTVRVERLLTPEPMPAFRLTLAQCVSGSEKMDWTIEKAVELGVGRLVPLQSQKAIVKLDAARSARRHAHWQRLIVAACAQSGRNRVPRLEAVAPLAAWLREHDHSIPTTPPTENRPPENGQPADGEHERSGNVVRILLAPEAPRSLPEILAATESAGGEGDAGSRTRGIEEVLVLCGPESGFSEAELLQAGGAGWLAARLGPRVLRTETAGLVALAVIQARWGDLR